MADSIATRLAAVDVAAAQAAESRAAHAALLTQLEAARLTMEADGATLRAAKRTVVDGLLALGGPAYLTAPDGSRTLVLLYRGSYRKSPMGDGTAPIPIG